MGDMEDGEYRHDTAGDDMRSGCVSPNRSDVRPGPDRGSGQPAPSQLARTGGDGAGSRSRSRRAESQSRQAGMAARSSGTDGLRGSTRRGIMLRIGDGDPGDASEWNRAEDNDDGAETRGRSRSRSHDPEGPRVLRMVCVRRIWSGCA